MPADFLKAIGQPGIMHSSPAMGEPVVSFCCPTYGTACRRPWLLNEVVGWYRRQTYPHRELLIVNDCPTQKLFCSNMLINEGVRIINFPYRFPTLGEKRNFLVTQAIGSIILPQDDDDISLPMRAEQAVKMLKKADYWSPQMYWFYEAGRGDMRPDGGGVGHNCAAYRRAAFYNRYPATSGDEDKLGHEWAIANLVVNPQTLADPADLTYVYRWGVSDRHISGFVTNHMQDAYDTFNPGAPGEYEVKDVITTDWAKEAQRISSILKSNNGTQSTI